MIAYPSSKQLLYFVQVAQCGSFTKAAKICNVTQSTLSAGIQEMESLLGASLFDRQGRKTRLSALGEAILPKALTILDGLSEITDMADLSQKPLSGPLRLGMIPTIAPYILPRLLPHLGQAYPNLNVKLHEDTSDALNDRLMSGQLDMAITSLSNPVTGLDHIAIDEEPLYLALPGDIAPKQKTLPTSNLNRYRLMLLDDLHDPVLESCNIQIRNSDRHYSAHSLQTLVQLVHEGYGATLIPQMALMQGLTKGMNIKCYAMTDPQPVRQIGIALPHHSRFKNDATLLAQDIQMTLTQALKDTDLTSSDNLEHSGQRPHQAA